MLTDTAMAVAYVSPKLPSLFLMSRLKLKNNFMQVHITKDIYKKNIIEAKKLANNFKKCFKMRLEINIQIFLFRNVQDYQNILKNIKPKQNQHIPFFNDTWRKNMKQHGQQESQNNYHRAKFCFMSPAHGTEQIELFCLLIQTLKLLPHD